MDHPDNVPILLPGRRAKSDTFANTPFEQGLIVGGLASPLTYLAAHLLGLLRKIFEENLGRAQQPPHPFGGEKGPERAPDSETVVASQDALDQRAELVRKHSGNVAFG